MEAVVSCTSLKCVLVQNLGKSKEENRLFKYTEKGCNLICSEMAVLRSNYSVKSVLRILQRKSPKYMQKLQWYLLASNWGQVDWSHFSPYEIGTGDTFLYHVQKCALEGRLWPHTLTQNGPSAVLLLLPALHPCFMQSSAIHLKYFQGVVWWNKSLQCSWKDFN